MKNLKNILKIIFIFIGFFSTLAIIAYFNIDDENIINNSLENIDDTKFPISDYLYFEEEKLKETHNESNNEVNLNPLANNEENNQIEEQIKKEENNNISNIFSNITSNTKEKLSIDIFKNDNNDDETIQDPPNQINKKNNKKLNKEIEALLATRFNKNVLTINKTKHESQIEYGVDSFSNLSEQDKASNEHKLYRTISAMKMIPAILITNISSDIGGKVIAQVEEDIYAEMGVAVLIPKGSKVLGNYASNNKIGEYRLSIFWTRILTPEGINIMLSDAYGADLSGAMGAIGNLDSKYWQRYGIPLALSTLSNGLILSINNITTKYTDKSNNNLLPFLNAELMQNIQGDISNIMAEIIREQVKIQPTIRIEKGSRIFITSSKDIFFPIPKKNEVVAKFFNEVKDEDEEEDKKSL